MTSQTSGAVPGSSPAWILHAGAAAADHSCATRLSLVRGASGAAPCKAPVGGGVGGPRVVRGHRAPPAGVVAPRPVVPEPRTPRDFPQPPSLVGVAAHRSCREETHVGVSAAAWLLDLQKTYLRPAPRASAGTSRGVPAPSSRDAGCSHATQTTPPAREAGGKEENS
jgi:hypothetical protein